jgi:hypothetical protein
VDGLNAMIIENDETGDDLVVWFSRGRLYLRSKDAGITWSMTAEHSQWFCEGLEALRQRSERRMARGE